MEKKYIKANIDEKNISSDWIFDCLLIDGDCSIRIPSDKGNSFVGLYGNSVVNVYWEATDNKVTVKFINTLTALPKEKDKDKLYHFFLEEFNTDTKDLITMVTQADNDTIIAKFYWEIEE